MGRNNVALKLLISAAFVVAAIAVLLAWQQPTEERAEAASTGPEIDMVVSSGTTGCPGGTPGDHVCVPVSGSLTLTISAIGIPAGGYIGVQTFVVFGPDLTYNITGSPTDEIVWPDCENVATVRSQFSAESVNHGCLTGLLTFPVSTYIGDLVELSFTCSAAFTSTELELLPAGDPFASSSGSGFAPAGGGGTIAAKVSNLIVDCVEPTPTPTDTPTNTPTDTPTNTPTPTKTPTPTNTRTPTPCPTEGCPTATPTPVGGPNKLLASDAQERDQFGYSVAISGDTAVVGAYATFPITRVGATFIYERNEGGPDNWGEVKKLNRYGLSVAISGDTMVIGAHTENLVGASNAGAAYIYERNEGGANNWGQVKRITASDAQANDELGWSVAVSGDTIVAGAWHEDSGGSNAGAAYVFDRDEGGAENWGEVKKVTASIAHADAWFGWSVAVSGDTALVGAKIEDTEDDNAGAAYLFDRNRGGADNWGRVRRIVASDAQYSAEFGDSVALDGDTAVVGARLHSLDDGTFFVTQSGAAYIFGRNAGGANRWGEVTKLEPNKLWFGGHFGKGVAISGDKAVVGAYSLPDKETFAGEGAAFVFQRDEGGAANWGHVTKLTALDGQNDDQFGWGVAVSDGTAIVGAYGQDKGGDRAGAAYVFDWLQAGSPPTPTPTATPKNPDADTDGDGIPNSSDWDDDNDGCTDEQENGSDEMLGGRRNPHSPWDFYDVAIAGAVKGLDQQVDLFNDAVSVIDHYAPSGLETEYDAWFDRGPTAGPNAWNMTAPDGVIDLFNDISGVIAQFGHDCR